MNERTNTPIVTVGDAASAFVEEMVKAEKYDYPAENACGFGYLWHGWALRDAFYAGARWAEATAENKRTQSPQATDSASVGDQGSAIHSVPQPAAAAPAKHCAVCGDTEVYICGRSDCPRTGTDDKVGRMNLRTITGWAIYDPKRKVIVTMKPLKRLAEPSKYPGCVLVKMKGHYVPPFTAAKKP